MKREPSIHVTRSCLIELFEEFGFDVNKITPFMLAAKNYALVGRRLIIENSKTRQNKLRKVSTEDIYLLGEFSLKFRQYVLDNKIRPTFPIINEHHSDWKYVKNAVKNLIEFCEQYNYDPHEMIDDFIELAHKVMGKQFSLHKFSYYRTRMLDYYHELYVIQNDPNKEETLRMMSFYLKLVNQMTRINLDDLKKRSVYYHFVLGSAEALKNNADVTDWVQAQFDAIAWADEIPEPSMMHNDRAVERYRKYLMKKKKR